MKFLEEAIRRDYMNLEKYFNKLKSDFPDINLPYIGTMSRKRTHKIDKF